MKNKNIKPNQKIYYYDGLDDFGNKKIRCIIESDDNQNMVKRINYGPCKVIQSIYEFDNNENIVKITQYLDGKLDFIEEYINKNFNKRTNYNYDGKIESFREIKCNENGSFNVTKFKPDGTIKNHKEYTFF